MAFYPIAWYTLTYHAILYHTMPCQIILLIQTKVQRTHPCCGDSGGAIFAPLLMSVYITLPDLTTLYHNSHYSHTFVKSCTIPFKVLDDNGISFHQLNPLIATIIKICCPGPHHPRLRLNLNFRMARLVSLLMKRGS